MPFLVDYGQLIENLPDTIPAPAEPHFLDGVALRIKAIDSELQNAKNAVNTFHSVWKVGFIEATGVSDEFFETYINNTGIMENLQSGVIQTNKDLLDVVQANLDKDGVFAKLSVEKQNAIIAEITLKNELIKINSKLFSEEQKLKEKKAEEQELKEKKAEEQKNKEKKENYIFLSLICGVIVITGIIASL